MIAVISDSHIPDRANSIPEVFQVKMKDADKVVHCGDFESEKVYKRLSENHDLIGVKGNCDYFDIESSHRFTRKRLDFGVYHGAGIHPRGHHPTLAKTARQLGVPVLFHGHTHQQEIAEHDGKILLNPGSCTGVGGGSSKRKDPSMMTVNIRDQKLEVEILSKDRDSGESYTSGEKTLNTKNVLGGE
jgi:phosphoesterase, MJ0936 family